MLSIIDLFVIEQFPCFLFCSSPPSHHKGHIISSSEDFFVPIPRAFTLGLIFQVNPFLSRLDLGMVGSKVRHSTGRRGNILFLRGSRGH
jgi:hypothetical protein